MSKKWRTRISLLLCVLLLYSLPEEMNIFVQALSIPMYVRAATSGSFSGGGTWEFNNGVMTITGNGKIPDEEFESWSSVNKIVIGKDVTEVVEKAFYLKGSITSVEFDADSTLTTIGTEAFKSNAFTTISLPANLTTIGTEAFASCNKLTSVTIPANVNSIGEKAFDGANALGSVKFAEGSQCTVIPEKAFAECKALDTITFPDGLTTIGDYAFENTKFSTITIPSSVTSIGTNPFSMCSSLETISVAGDGKYKDQGSNAIINTDTNELITGCKNTTIPDGVEKIGDLAFKDCTDLASVELPNTVKFIGTSAFHGCNSLKSITGLDNVESIGTEAFCKCEKLIEVQLPNNITSLSKMLFDKCYNLTQIEIPSSVKSIGESAFRDCTSLSSITIPNVPDGVCIKKSAFENCTSLSKITIQGTITTIEENAFDGCNPETLIFEDGVNSTTIKTILGNTGMSTSNLKDVVVPDSLLAEVNTMGELDLGVRLSLISKTAYDARNKGADPESDDDDDDDDDSDDGEKKETVVQTSVDKKLEDHTHNYTRFIVRDVMNNQYGLEVLRCSCCEAKEIYLIPSSAYIVKDICPAIIKAPANGIASCDSGENWRISDYIIKRLDERKDVTVLINFEYNGEKCLMTIPARRDYTKLLKDENYFYDYFSFKSLVPGVKIEKVS